MRKSASISWPVFMCLVFLGGCKGTTLAGGGDNEPELKLTAVDLNLDGASSETGQVADGETSVEIANLSATEYVRQVVIELGAHFLPENICAGKTIFGRLGEAACMTLIDNRFNDVGTPATKRKTPRITGVIDDDGYNSSAVVEVDRTGPGGAWAARTCGITAATSITERIADCADEFVANATWDGATKSNVSHGKFVLVSRAASGKEVWRDERTNLLWSSRVGATTYNWCRAAGVGGVNDPDDICDDPGNQDQTTPESVCAEGTNSDDLTLQSFVAGEDWTAGTYDNGKGQLGAHANAGEVQWSLPSREEYMQAYTNGLGYVVPDLGDGSYYWLSSVYSGTTNTAWSFNAGPNGHVTVDGNDIRNTDYPVRCVGR